MKTEKTTTLAHTEAVEVLDGLGRPLGVIPAAEAHRQSLPHRSAMVLLFDSRGKLFLRRRDASEALYPGRWDIPAVGHVRPGESREDAAQRVTRERLPVSGGALLPHGELPPGPSTGFERVSLYKYLLPGTAKGLRGFDETEWLLADAEELTALATDFRELFSPAVIHALEHGALRPGKRDGNPEG